MREIKKRYYIYIGVVVLVILLLVSQFLKKEKVSELRDGFLTINEDSSDLIPGLFYTDSKKHVFVNIKKLNDCLNVDVVRSKDTYIISTIKNQILIYENENTYAVNSNKVTDDKYQKPISINSYIYADSDIIFKLLGYKVTYEMNADETVIEGVLKQADSFDSNKYSALETKGLVKEPTKPATEQIEDQLVEPEGKAETKEALPVVPEPTEIDASNVTSTETYYVPDDNTEDIKETDHESETKDLSDNKPALPTESAFKEERWKKVKTELVHLFKNSPSNFGQNAIADLGDNGICYNQSSKGTLGNTVTVLKDSYDGHYIVATLAADWSDQANNVTSIQSKAYYSGLEEVYKNTIVSLLGEKEGVSFFEYLKKHADELKEGGYISQYDDKGILRSVWTDEFIGDGLQASTLELSQWTNRKTDDGLRYDIIRNGDGLMIIIF